MRPELQHNLIHQVLFPMEGQDGDGNMSSELLLEKLVRYTPSAELDVISTELVIFDFETTGLDQNEDQIIEVGAIKIKNAEIVDEFSFLVDPGMELTSAITQLTGITNEMLQGQPTIDFVLPKFLEFIRGTILVAHNADFDLGFLSKACQRLGYRIQWPTFCTLKMARQLLPDLESKNLDSLAAHYGLSFESRHRSIGDVKVTAGVLQAFLTREATDLKCWQDFEPFMVGRNL